MYYIYKNDQFFQSVANISQVGDIVESALLDEPDAWINVKSQSSDQPLPVIMLPLATPDPSLLLLTQDEIAALGLQDVTPIENQGN